MRYFIHRIEISDSVPVESEKVHFYENLKIHQQFNCRQIGFWFDKDRGIAFSLYEAPAKKSFEQLHQYSHPNTSNHIFEVEKSIVESFIKKVEG